MVSTKDRALHAYQHVDLRPDSPLLVFIYGGAWRKGSKSDYAFVGKALVAEGYRVVIPDYRLYPVVMYPDIFNDVHLAVMYVREHTIELGIPDDPHIVLMGHTEIVISIAPPLRFLNSTMELITDFLANMDPLLT